MALIEVYHVVADYYEVDPDWTEEIIEGMLVRITGHGTKTYVAPATTASVFGVAGDTLSNDQAGTPFATDLVIGSAGTVSNPVARTRSTQNRVSDMFNETLASGRMTVYHSGGKFKTNQYVTNLNYTVGAPLYASAAGLFTTAAVGTQVGVCTNVAAAEPSGVPGTDTSDNSTSLGTYITFKLLL